jgi:hypothetical protein
MVANLIGQIIGWFLSLGKVVTAIIDAIFGTDWTAGLNSLQAEVISWGKSETAVTLSREAPQVQRLDLTDAYDAGAGVGRDFTNWVGSVGDNIKGSLNGLTNGDMLLDANNSLPNPNAPEYNLENSYNPEALDALNAIEDNTDELDLTNDELDYLRRLAEMEWRNEFTTAEIKVDMTNYNNVNGDQDLDGIVEYLSDVLKDEMHSVAYGVHY